jgi:UDP:flavonoid glycosyltransferase YjiC (YdhE family)
MTPRRSEPSNRIKHLARALGTKRRILFFGEAVSLAHVARPAVLARWAREAGHEVHFACGARYAGVARGEGLDPLPLPTVEPADFYRRLSRGKFFYTYDELIACVQAELRLIREVKPDLVVGDFRLTLPVSAKLAGVKCLTLSNAHWSPAAERRLGAPEGGLFGLLPRFVRQPLFDAIKPLAYRFFAAPLDRVRRSFGLPGFDDFREHYTAGDFCAYLDLPELFPALGLGLWGQRLFRKPNAQSPKSERAPAGRGRRTRLRRCSAGGSR